MGRATPLCNSPHVLSLCMDSEDEATSPSVSHNRPCARVLATQPRHAVAGISSSSPRSLATNTRVRGLTSKQWKPVRSHIPAIHGCDGVSPQSHSCAPGLIHPLMNFEKKERSVSALTRPVFFFFFFMNGNTEWAQCAPSRVCIPKKRKRKAVKRIKQVYKISKQVIRKKKSCHLVRKVVIDLPFEGSWKYRRRERVPKAGSRREETITEPIHS